MLHHLIDEILKHFCCQRRHLQRRFVVYQDSEVAETDAGVAEAVAVVGGNVVQDAVEIVVA